jgi:nucleoside-diphosphate-sugar epimerase
MLHAAAKGESYACFVRPDARIPFMTMPEAINAIQGVMSAPSEHLTQVVYNVQSFSPSAEEFLAHVRAYFDEVSVNFEPDLARQSIIDSWPESVDDSRARRDWNWNPTHTIDTAFSDYLVPKIKERYL